MLLAYLSARKLRWPTTAAIAFASLIAFQPMFLATSAIVNIDILLIFAFSLFFYGAVTWLTAGPTLSSVVLLLSATSIGIFAKGPGIVLLGPLGLLGVEYLYRRLGWPWRDFLLRAVLATFVALSFIFIFTPPAILAGFLHLGSDSVFTSSFESLAAYAEKTLTAGALLWTATTYWGSFGWLDTNLPAAIIQFILALETTAGFGLLWLFFDKYPPRFLPNKRVLLFPFSRSFSSSSLSASLIGGYFDATGKILIGTPGRYFLPNILPHLLLIVSGLGYFLPTKFAFDRMLVSLSTLLFLLTTYATWAIILPRYYL